MFLQVSSDHCQSGDAVRATGELFKVSYGWARMPLC
jgi:hypothetical protein